MSERVETPDSSLIPASGTIVVADLEYTSWEGALERGWSGPNEYREVVQIGAVRLDAGCGFRETAAFEVLVRPRINPELSDYFVTLTGITNKALADRGMTLEAAFEAFTEFVGRAPVLSHGADDMVIAEDCARRTIANPFAEHDWRNIAPAVRRVTGEKLPSGELPAHFGLEMDGRAHDALADARALAQVLAHLRERSEI